MSDLYDVKISVRSSVKLLPEIEGLLSMKPNRERLFKNTVFGPWLDIQSHENDSHMMHYVFQHQGEYMWEKFYNRTVNVVSKHTEHHLDQLKKNPKFNATYNLYGFAWAFKMMADGVLDSQTKDVIEQAAMLPTMSSNSPQAGNAALETSETFVKFKKLLTNDLCSENESSDCNQKKSDGGVSIEEKPNFSSHHNDSSNHIGGVSSEAKASSSSARPGNDEDVSHLDDNMEIDGQNAKDGYSNSQHHLHLLIKALGTKIENLSIDVVVPPKVDDPMLHIIKPKYDFDEADVDSYDDDYMSLFNDEEQPAKSSLNDLELQQEPDKVDVKDGILEQQPIADKGKTTVI
ncbi:hypothetical protein Tco_0218251 [Tanacetum coccineum]